MCVNCNNSNIPPALVKSNRKQKGEVITCDYTTEQVTQWQTTLLCIKNSNLLTEVGVTSPQMNGFLGVLASIIKYNNNPCSFVNTLDKILDVIIRTVGLNLCQ